MSAILFSKAGNDVPKITQTTGSSITNTLDLTATSGHAVAQTATIPVAQQSSNSKSAFDSRDSKKSYLDSKYDRPKTSNPDHKTHEIANGTPHISELESILAKEPYYIPINLTKEAVFPKDEQLADHIYIRRLPALHQAQDAIKHHTVLMQDSIEYCLATKGEIKNRRVCFLLPPASNVHYNIYPAALLISFNKPKEALGKQLYEEIAALKDPYKTLLTDTNDLNNASSIRMYYQGLCNHFKDLYGGVKAVLISAEKDVFFNKDMPPGDTPAGEIYFQKWLGLAYTFAYNQSNISLCPIVYPKANYENDLTAAIIAKLKWDTDDYTAFVHVKINTMKKELEEMLQSSNNEMIALAQSMLKLLIKSAEYRLLRHHLIIEAKASHDSLQQSHLNLDLDENCSPSYFSEVFAKLSKIDFGFIYNFFFSKVNKPVAAASLDGQFASASGIKASSDNLHATMTPLTDCVAMTLMLEKDIKLEGKILKGFLESKLQQWKKGQEQDYIELVTILEKLNEHNPYACSGELAYQILIYRHHRSLIKATAQSLATLLQVEINNKAKIEMIVKERMEFANLVKEFQQNDGLNIVKNEIFNLLIILTKQFVLKQVREKNHKLSLGAAKGNILVFKKNVLVRDILAIKELYENWKDEKDNSNERIISLMPTLPKELILDSLSLIKTQPLELLKILRETRKRWTEELITWELDLKLQIQEQEFLDQKTIEFLYRHSLPGMFGILLTQAAQPLLQGLAQYPLVHSPVSWFSSTAKKMVTLAQNVTQGVSKQASELPGYLWHTSGQLLETAGMTALSLANVAYEYSPTPLSHFVLSAALPIVNYAVENITQKTLLEAKQKITIKTRAIAGKANELAKQAMACIDLPVLSEDSPELLSEAVAEIPAHLSKGIADLAEGIQTLGKKCGNIMLSQEGLEGLSDIYDSFTAENLLNGITQTAGIGIGLYCSGGLTGTLRFIGVNAFSDMLFSHQHQLIVNHYSTTYCNRTFNPPSRNAMHRISSISFAVLDAVRFWHPAPIITAVLGIGSAALSTKLIPKVISPLRITDKDEGDTLAAKQLGLYTLQAILSYGYTTFFDARFESIRGRMAARDRFIIKERAKFEERLRAVQGAYTNNKVRIETANFWTEPSLWGNEGNPVTYHWYANSSRSECEINMDAEPENCFEIPISDFETIQVSSVNRESYVLGNWRSDLLDF